MILDKLVKSHSTICEMLEDRGFQVPLEVRMLGERKEELLNKYNENNLYFECKKKNEVEEIACLFYQPFFEDVKQIGVDKIKNLLLAFEDLLVDKSSVILVSSNNFTHYAIKEIKKKFTKLEIFYNNELYINITKHILNPKFILLSDDERKCIIESFKGSLPSIKISDPMCRYFNVSTGNVFQIIRPNGELYYRMVVP